MLSIWSYALVTEHKNIQRLTNQFLIDTITMTAKLIISCFINGLVYDESDKIMATLDNINAHHINDYQYRELLLFKSISRESNFGFSIGGFAPLRKTTLIQVFYHANYYLTLKNSISYQIFVFILNYTIILVQTMKWRTTRWMIIFWKTTNFHSKLN